MMGAPHFNTRQRRQTTRNYIIGLDTWLEREWTFRRHTTQSNLCNRALQKVCEAPAGAVSGSDLYMHAIGDEEKWVVRCP